MTTTPVSLPKTAPANGRWRLRPNERRALLLIGDLVIGYLSLLVALYLWASGDQWLNFSLEFLKTRPPAWFFFIPLGWLMLMAELYDDRKASDVRKTLQSVAVTALIALGLYLILYFFYTTPKSLPRRGIAFYIGAAFILTCIWRLLYIRIFTAPQFMRRMLLVGAGETGKTLMQVYREAKPSPFYWVGVVDDDPQKIGTEIEGYMILGGSEKLLDIIAAESVSDIIVAISGEMQGRMFQTLLDAQEKGVAITRFPVAYEELVRRVPIRHLEADWILRSFVDQAHKSGFFHMTKRVLDLTGGLFGVLIFLASFPFVSLAIILDSGFPIFYTQTRSGRGDLRYAIFKYRTMKQNAEANGQPQWAEENDKRATRVGRFLRKTHIDELPQFFNVVRGEMSLVGPRAERPELVAWFQQHVPFYRARLLVKPGITGWAQINFGYASTIDETITKLEYDLYYIKHRSIWMDLLILLKTPATVFELKGR